MRLKRRLRLEQFKKLVVFRWKVEAGAITGQAGDDSAVFLAETGRFEREAELFPTPRVVGCEPYLVCWRDGFDGCCERSDGLLDAFVRRCQFQLSIERFEMMSELFLQALDGIDP